MLQTGEKRTLKRRFRKKKGSNNFSFNVFAFAPKHPNVRALTHLPSTPRVPSHPH
jgi:hypothetical protein